MVDACFAFSSLVNFLLALNKQENSSKQEAHQTEQIFALGVEDPAFAGVEEGVDSEDEGEEKAGEGVYVETIALKCNYVLLVFFEFEPRHVQQGIGLLLDVYNRKHFVAPSGFSTFSVMLGVCRFHGWCKEHAT